MSIINTVKGYYLLKFVSTHFLSRWRREHPVAPDPVDAYFTRNLRVLIFCLEMLKSIIFKEKGVVK